MSLFGRIYRVFTFGQSHSAMTGCVIEGFPSNTPIDLASIQAQLARRRPGQSPITTPRNQQDQVQCISGMQNGRSLGSPLCFLVRNENVKKEDYRQFQSVPRPGHADLSYLQKYGIKAQSGGGRSSARETIGRVIAGALAKQYLKTLNITFASWVYAVANHKIPQPINHTFILQKLNNQTVEARGCIRKDNFGYIFLQQNKAVRYQCSTMTKTILENSLDLVIPPIQANLRCPYPLTTIQMYESILKAKLQQDSLGGIIQGCIYGLPAGLGEPVFDKVQALLAHAMLSIPATKGFEFGSGFPGTQMKGSTHNDMFDESLRLRSNNSGGSLGGITSGETFQFKVAFKPVSTIGKVQETCDYNGNKVELKCKGRHDPCVLPRAGPIVQNMAAIVILDLLLLQGQPTNKFPK